jgi:hypothetical protein
MNHRVAEQAAGLRPRVSVAVITYNHERFIAQAIEGVLNQEVDFAVELVIGEDCSTDGTRAIVQAYARQYPNVIRPLLPEKNIGMQHNFIRVIEACTGDFIAYFEGDDLWIHPGKLARQAAFLAANGDCATCFHNAIAFFDDPTRAVPDLDHAGNRLMCGPGTKARFTQKDFFRGNAIPTCSVMFRRSAIGRFPDWFKDIGIGDLPLHILCTQHGAAAYINEVMSAYRLHPGSCWSSKNALARIPVEIKMFATLVQHFNALPASPAVRRSRQQARRALARARGKWELARARAGLDTNPALVAPALWRAWRLYPRQLKWLLRWVCAVWPRALGGAYTSAHAHRKLREKF